MKSDGIIYCRGWEELDESEEGQTGFDILSGGMGEPSPSALLILALMICFPFMKNTVLKRLLLFGH